MDWTRILSVTLLAAGGCASIDHGEGLPRTPIVRMIVEDDVATAVLVPLSLAALPPRARFAANAIVPPTPGRQAWVLWSADAMTGLRIEATYGPNLTDHRTVLVTRTGRILERTHSVPASQVPTAIRTPATAHGPEHHPRYEFVQGSGPNRFRATYANGTSTDFELDGTPLQSHHLIRTYNSG